MWNSFKVYLPQHELTNGMVFLNKETRLYQVASTYESNTSFCILLGYVLEETMFILNRVPSKSVQDTIWDTEHEAFQFVFFEIWGCKVSNLWKISTKSDKCLLWGILKKQKDLRRQQFREKSIRWPKCYPFRKRV